MQNFSISILDLMLLIVTGLFAFRSLFKGAAKSIFSLLGILAAYLVASLYYQSIAERFVSFLGRPAWLNLAGFASLFVGVLIIFSLLEVSILQIFMLADSRQSISGLLAFILGIIEGFLFCSIVLWILQNRALPNSKEFLENSIFASYYLEYNPLLIGLESRLQMGVF